MAAPNMPPARMRGQVDVESKMDLTNEAQRRDYEQAKARSEARQKMITPGGSGQDPLGLGAPLLEQRRLEFGVPDACFDVQPMFDCCVLYQIPRFDDKIGAIHVPDETKKAHIESALRALLLAAGCAALDQLKSNGCDVGHIVTFVALSPYRTLACWIDGSPVWILQVQAKHLRGSEDLRERLRRREVLMVETRNENGYFEHHFKDREGKVWHPQMPWGDASLT